jgi:CubicO group peptidase (beta-lactamase class C family)
MAAAGSPPAGEAPMTIAHLSRRTAALAAVLLSLTLGVQTSPQQADPKFEQLAALVEAKMAEYGVPGVAFGVVKDGKATLRGFGVTSVDHPQPITPETVFPIASISKTVATTAFMRLVELGKLDLDAPVRQYLPDFAVQDATATRDVRVWHLLTHTPGWEGQLTAPDRGSETLANFAATMKDLPQLAPPGEVWSYNNAGFTLAGRVIEAVTEQPIQTAIRDLVFRPLGLTRAFTRLEDVVTHEFSVAHRTQDGKPAVSRPMTRSSSVTAGGVSMSLADLLTYASFHLGDGTNRNGARVLSRASLERMRTPRVKKVGTDDEMGLGWHLRRINGVMTAAHGGTLGHILLVEIVPERNLAFAILTNHSGGWRLIQDVERALLRDLEGLPLDPAHAIGHRGLNETMPDAPLLATPPDPAPYVGTYTRPPLSSRSVVRVENGQLMLDRSTIAFYAPDRAVVTSGNGRGNPVEFIRDASGVVLWVRVVGRIARRE